MNCPGCGNPTLRTVETFQTPQTTFRTRQCPACKERFTSAESITDTIIPKVIRNTKRCAIDAARKESP